MFSDIEELMDDMFIQLKAQLPLKLAAISTAKGDTLLDEWLPIDEAYYLDAADVDIPPYKSSIVFFIASDPLISTHDNSQDLFETYTLGISVILADNFKKDFFRVKKRFSKALKQVITKSFNKRYISNPIKMNSSTEVVITTPNGTSFQVCATYFDISIIE